MSRAYEGHLSSNEDFSAQVSIYGLVSSRWTGAHLGKVRIALPCLSSSRDGTKKMLKTQVR